MLAAERYPAPGHGDKSTATATATATPGAAASAGVTAVAGRRASARLRLAIPARFVSITATQNCILLDISRTGARFALATPTACRQSGYLAIGRLELFGVIVRSEQERGGGINALAFDEPISNAEVLAIRSFAENFELRERQALRDQVRRWVAGEA